MITAPHMERWQQLGFESFAAWQKETGKQRAKASYERRKAEAAAASAAAAAAAAAEGAPAEPMNVDPQQVGQAPNENADAATKAARRRARRQRRARRTALKEVHPNDHDQIDVVDHWLAFEMEALEAHDSGDEGVVLPEDPIERAIALGREDSLKPDQQTELNRRRLMKALADHRARLSRSLPQYINAFRLDEFAPTAPDWCNQNWIYRSGHYDERLDLDLGFRTQLSVHYPQPKLLKRPSPPPAETRFWLTEAELSDPELLAQRLEDVRPHIERELLRQQLEPEARAKACQLSFAAAHAVGVNPIEWMSKQSDDYLRADAGLSTDEVQLLRDGKSATQEQVLKVAELAYFRRFYRGLGSLAGGIDSAAIPEPVQVRDVLSLPRCTCCVCSWREDTRHQREAMENQKHFASQQQQRELIAAIQAAVNAAPPNEHDGRSLLLSIFGM